MQHSPLVIATIEDEFAFTQNRIRFGITQFHLHKTQFQCRTKNRIRKRIIEFKTGFGGNHPP